MCLADWLREREMMADQRLKVKLDTFGIFSKDRFNTCLLFYSLLRDEDEEDDKQKKFSPLTDPA